MRSAEGFEMQGSHGNRYPITLGTLHGDLRRLRVAERSSNDLVAIDCSDPNAVVVARPFCKDLFREDVTFAPPNRSTTRIRTTSSVEIYSP